MTRSSLAAALLPAIQTILGISQPARLLHKACCWHTRITTIRHRRTKPRSTCRAHPRSRNRGISENGFDYGSLSAAQCGSRPKTATLTILRAAICGSYPKIATLTPPQRSQMQVSSDSRRASTHYRIRGTPARASLCHNGVRRTTSSKVKRTITRTPARRRADSRSRSI